MAVRTDVDQMKGFSKRQSPEELHQLPTSMYEPRTQTCAKVLEVERAGAGKLPPLHGRGREAGGPGTSREERQRQNGARYKWGK